MIRVMACVIVAAPTMQTGKDQAGQNECKAAVLAQRKQRAAKDKLAETIKKLH